MKIQIYRNNMKCKYENFALKCKVMNKQLVIKGTRRQKEQNKTENHEVSNLRKIIAVSKQNVPICAPFLPQIYRYVLR